MAIFRLHPPPNVVIVVIVAAVAVISFFSVASVLSGPLNPLMDTLPQSMQRTIIQQYGDWYTGR